MDLIRNSIKNSRYMQYIAAIAATSTYISVGLSFTWPSPTLPKLQSENSPIGYPITDEEGSWLVSITLLSSIPGCILGGYTIDKLGRKPNILMTSTITSLHFFAISFGNSFWLLLLSRLIGGLSMSIAGLASTIYIGEIAENDIRGKLSTYLMLLKVSGSLMGLVIGPNVSYRFLGIFSGCIPMITVLMFCFIPETPFFLVKTHKVEEAKKCLKQLSGENVSCEDIEEKLCSIQEIVRKDMENKGSIKELIGNEKYRYPIFLMMGIKSLQQLSGSVALESYLQKIIDLSKSGIKSEIVSIIIGCIQLPTVFISSVLVDKLGRKPLLITSAFGCFFALFITASYFLHIDNINNIENSFFWVPTVGLSLFWVFYPMGILPLPYVLIGELFPVNIKEIAVAFLCTYGACIGFLTAKLFKPVSNLLGIHTVLYLFSGICFFGACFVYWFLPETKGKDFQEIQNNVCKRDLNWFRKK
nr:facilitated trehalose transporter Tret1-like [Onthophagus taurus]